MRVVAEMWPEAFLGRGPARSGRAGRSVRPPRGRPGAVTRRVRAGAVAVGLLAVMAVLSSCLGPDEFDPTGTAPIGSLDFAVGDGASIRLVGWALDPDTAAPIDVMVSVQSVAVPHRADLQRADIAAVYPGHGGAHGFDVRTPPLPPGPNQVCIWAVNVVRGEHDRALGCLDVVTGSDDATGNLESVTQLRAGVVRVAGWGYDAEAGGSVEISLTFDGVTYPRTSASVWRPDVAAVFRKSANYGFQIDIPAAPGIHTACITVHSVGRGSDKNLGCRSVAVDSVPHVGPGAGISSVQAVGPPQGHPLTGMDRDGGVSTRLRDGSTLWLFGDTAEPLAGGGYRYFVNNTAAWAAAGSPTVTRDAVAPGNVPYTFVTPAAAFDVACPVGFTPVMWPLSATNVPDGATSRDRVIAFFGNVCLNGNEAESRGVAMVEWVYDPSLNHDGRRIQGTVIDQNMFPIGVEYGTASMVDGGFLYAYECGRPGDGVEGVIWPNDPAYDGCTVARVLPDQRALLSAWRYWDGDDWTDPSNWVAAPASAATLSIPTNAGGTDPDKQLPVATLSVTKDPVFGYTMTYSPWPGYTQEVFVRTAASPVGAWSNRTLITLPGCVEWSDGVQKLCYSATAQPWRSQPGQIGIGYYDQYVAQDPARGAYLSANAPFAG